MAVRARCSSSGALIGAIGADRRFIQTQSGGGVACAGEKAGCPRRMCPERYGEYG